jgi:hypothetical protein
MGVDVSEESGQRSGGQLPKLPPREEDRAGAERSEKQDQKRGWLPEALSLIVDLISSWH